MAVQEWDKDYFNRVQPKDGDIVVYGINSADRSIRVGIVMDDSCRAIRGSKHINEWQLLSRDAVLRNWQNVIVLNPLEVPDELLTLLQNHYDEYMGITEAV